MKATSTRNAEHYTWGEQCDGWYLVRNDMLNVIEERMPHGTSETLHRHHRAQQSFYVLSGAATIEIDQEVVVLQVNECVLVRAGAAHRIHNSSGGDLRVLVTSVPPSHGDREELSALP